MSKDCLIGIDLGTTLAKCVLDDAAGAGLAEAQEAMRLRYPRSGEAEQDAEDFYSCSCALIRQCLQASRLDPDRVAAVGIDSQMGGIMTVDRRFQPVTYFDTPLDSRCAAENLDMHARFGERILALNGSLSTYGPKILYWKKKDAWRDIAKFLQPSAFVAGRLAGHGSEDAYMDRTFLCFSGLSDLQGGRWSEELCGAGRVGEGAGRRLPLRGRLRGPVRRLRRRRHPARRADGGRFGHRLHPGGRGG